MINFSKFSSLFSLVNYFSSNEKCKEAIAESRWADGDVICPYCGQHHCTKHKDGRYRCNHCKRNFSVMVGTIFENTNISLKKWFMAMYLISSNKKGVSSCQLARDIEVTQKTAWFMLQKVRTLFAQDDSVALSGTIECDEVYIGGKERLKHLNKRVPGTQGRSTKTKTPIFGLMQRATKTIGSFVHAVVVDKTDRATLLPIIEQFCEEGSTVITDELTSYSKMNKSYKHLSIAHKQNEFVTGTVYTNNIEGFWNHLRRMITGTYHYISDKYLQRYLDEAVYRWNSREKNEANRFEEMFDKSIGIVDYKAVRMAA